MAQSSPGFFFEAVVVSLRQTVVDCLEIQEEMA